MPSDNDDNGCGLLPDKLEKAASSLHKTAVLDQPWGKHLKRH